MSSPDVLPIEASGLTFQRSRGTGLESVDFRLEPGECVGVIGPNGSGKTTLLQALRGQLNSTGSLRLAGIDPRRAPRAEVARRVAVVPQRTEFAFPYRVDEMVLFGRTPYRRPWERFDSEDRARVTTVLEELGIGDLATARVDALSGGERRKVFLARALVQETPILFLDEPTAGLDPPATAEFVRRIQTERARRSLSVVIVVHELSVARALCSRLVGVRGGRVIVDDAVERVHRPETLSDLFGGAWTEYRSAEDDVVLFPRVVDGDARGGDAR